MRKPEHRGRGPRRPRGAGRSRLAVQPRPPPAPAGSGAGWRTVPSPAAEGRRSRARRTVRGTSVLVAAPTSCSSRFGTNIRRRSVTLTSPPMLRAGRGGACRPGGTAAARPVSSGASTNSQPAIAPLCQSWHARMAGVSRRSTSPARRPRPRRAAALHRDGAPGPAARLRRGAARTGSRARSAPGPWVGRGRAGLRGPGRACPATRRIGGWPARRCSWRVFPGNVHMVSPRAPRRARAVTARPAAAPGPAGPLGPRGPRGADGQERSPSSGARRGRRAPSSRRSRRR